MGQLPRLRDGIRALAIVGLATCTVSASYAELQNVQVGGEIRIRGRYWIDTYSNGVNGAAQIRYPAFLLPLRDIGPTGANSRFDWSRAGNDLSYVEQRSLLHVKADFTNKVSAVMDFESFGVWGKDFRSNYITGLDGRNVLGATPQLLNAYIQADQIEGYPISIRIGRQPLKLGKGWLVNDLISATIGITFDAVRATYSTDQFDVDAWWSKLAENSPLEQDGDVDFYGVYGTYKGFKTLSLSAYWFLVRDARSLNDTQSNWLNEWAEDQFGLDDYNVTNLNTVGFRAVGSGGGFDYDLELAHQFGSADAAGIGFKHATYGDNRADYDTWGADLEAGYTFDVPWKPRAFVGGAYFSGEDNRDISLGHWLTGFYRPKASLSFNRMFSGTVYSWILDTGQDFSNFNQVRAGVEFRPMEKVTAYVSAAYFQANDPFDAPRSFTLGKYRVTIAPNLGFWTQESSSDLGVNTYCWVKYDYSDNLFIKLGWEHLFTGDGLADGNFTHRNGLEFSGGRDQHDADYLFFDMGTKF